MADESIGSEAGQQVMQVSSIKHMALDQRVARVVGQLVCDTTATAEGWVGQDMAGKGGKARRMHWSLVHLRQHLLLLPGSQRLQAAVHFSQLHMGARDTLIGLMLPQH